LSLKSRGLVVPATRKKKTFKKEGLQKKEIIHQAKMKHRTRPAELAGFMRNQFRKTVFHARKIFADDNPQQFPDKQKITFL